MAMILLMAYLILQNIPLYAQTNFQLADYQVNINKIDSIAYRKHVFYLADDLLEGREAGKAGQFIAARYLAAEFGKAGLFPGADNQTYYQIFNYRNSEEGYTQNVIGYLPGRGRFRDEHIIITAHYDHLGKKNGQIYNGADDNATGTAALLVLATAFADYYRKVDTIPRRSILFIATTAEEKGLFGSAQYVKNPVMPLAQCVANLNLDMIGRQDERSSNWNKPYGIYLIGKPGLSEPLFHINEKANDACCQLLLDYYYHHPGHGTRIYQQSDHYHFAEAGIPVIFYFSGLHPDYHKPTDDADKIDYAKALKVIRLVFSTIWELVHQEKVR